MSPRNPADRGMAGTAGDEHPSTGRPLAPVSICEHCDAVYRRRPLARGEAAHCLRCGATMYRHPGLELDAMLALVITGLILFVIANAYPIVSLEFGQATAESTLWGAVLDTYDSGVGAIAALAAATVFFFPLTQLLLFAWVLVPLHRGQRPVGFVPAMRLLRLVQPWSMVEVFLLGALVAVVKLAGVAQVIVGAGLYAFGALTLLLAALTAFDLHDLWDAAEDSAP